MEPGARRPRTHGRGRPSPGARSKAPPTKGHEERDDPATEQVGEGQRDQEEQRDDEPRPHCARRAFAIGGRRARSGVGIPAATLQTVSPSLRSRTASKPLPIRITKPGNPSSATSTFEPNPSTSQATPCSRQNWRLSATSSVLDGCSIAEAGPPIRYVVCLLSGSSTEKRLPNRLPNSSQGITLIQLCLHVLRSRTTPGGTSRYLVGYGARGRRRTPRSRPTLS